MSSKFCQNVVKMVVKMLSKCCRNVVKMLSKCKIQCHEEKIQAEMTSYVGGVDTWMSIQALG